jgi:hypothetical protein
VQTGPNAVSWTLQRMGIALGILVLAAGIAYATWVFVIVVGQAFQ